MKEQLITVRTAILAKEKGFSFESMDNNYELGYHDYFYWHTNKNRIVAISHYEKDNTHSDGWISMGLAAPTQSLLQKWLRENHAINMLLEPYPDYYWCYVFRWTKDKQHSLDGPEGIGDTYEDALEKGLQKALKLI